MGLFSSVLEAIFGQDERLVGRRVTRLEAPLLETETATMTVEATNGFGRWKDGTTESRVLVGGELIHSMSRTGSTFDTLTRGVDDTRTPRLHYPGTLVFDASDNKSAFDHLRRGLFVEYATGEDLDVIGSNLGLHRCPGMTDDVWREVIKAVAYLPKTTLDAFHQALTALLGSGFTVRENLIESPYQVFVEVATALSNSLRGKFFLNGGEAALTVGLNTVDVIHDVNQVLGVYDDTVLTRRGFREGFTNYATSNTFVGNSITLDVSPGPIGTKVIVDYGAFTAHFLATDETVREDEDFYAYLADPFATARCLLDQIRAAGVRVNFSVV